MAKRALLNGLALGLVLVMVLSSASPANAQPSGSSSVDVQIRPLYDLFGSNVAQITVAINDSYPSPLQTRLFFNVTTSFKPVVADGTANVNGTNESFQGSITRVILYTTDFRVPNGTTSFQVVVQGSESGSSFLWRYLVGIPYVALSGPTLYPLQYFVTVPLGTLVSQLYGPTGGNLPLSDLRQVSTGANGVTYSVFGNPQLLVSQSRSFLPASIAITAAALAVVALAALNLFSAPRQLFGSVFGQLRARAKELAKAARLSGGRRGFNFRGLFQPRKLLALFILCALVMVALGATAGPDPRLKAYVVADSTTTTEITAQLQQLAGNVLVLTPQQDYTDFNVMSSVGQFNLVVISSDSATQIAEQSSFILPYLGDVPIIIVDNATDPTLRSAIVALYPDQVLPVQSAGALTSADIKNLQLQLSLNERANVLGLNISAQGFKYLLAIEAALSMLLVLIGWAYLGSLSSESRSMSDLYNLVVVIGAGIFVFVFSEAVYIATSSLLAVPLSLHAVTSDAHDVTAIGLLGFGGGSTPRLAAGFLGVLVGAVGAGGGLRVRKSDFALIGGVSLVLLANPLAIGQYIFQGILLFFPVGNYAFGLAYASSLSVKGFIYGIGAFVGGGVTPTYLLSAGKILFFAGLVPLAFLKKMGRTTTVIALLMVALLIGDGGVRVGEMTPEKTVAAVLPGLVAGFAFAAVLLGFAVIEKYVRGNWKSRA